MLKSAYCISFLKIIILLIFSCSEKFSAQSFKLLRYDENYEFLKDSENKKSLRELIRLERPKKLKDDRVLIFYTSLVLLLLLELSFQIQYL